MSERKMQERIEKKNTLGKKETHSSLVNEKRLRDREKEKSCEEQPCSSQQYAEMQNGMQSFPHLHVNVDVAKTFCNLYYIIILSRPRCLPISL